MTRIFFLAGLILMALVAGVSAQQPVPSVTGKITIRWKKPPVITLSPAELPSGDYDVTYPSIQMVANGGSEPYEFIIAGGLPPGLTLNKNGLLSGVPVKEGAYAFTVGVIDKDDFKGKRNYSISILASEIDTPPQTAVPVNTQISLSPAEVPGGSYDANYSNVQFVANGGTGPYTYQITSGRLPAGLTMTPGGLLSGVPVEDGAFPFTVSALDKQRSQGNRNYSITIEANAVPTAQAPCPYGTVRFGADCVKDATVATPQPPVYPITPTTQPPVYPTPTATLYPREVQNELKRVGCLRASGVDGQWGGGSRAALSKFYRQAGLSAAGTEPTQIVLSDVQSQRGQICQPVYVAPPPKKKKKPTTTGYKPKCSKIKYAYTSGNTCKCSGGRNFNGKYCVKIASPPPQDQGPNLGDIIGAGLCIAAQAQCNKKGGYFNSSNCSCSYGGGGGGGGGYTPKCYKSCNDEGGDCETVCE